MWSWHGGLVASLAHLGKIQVGAFSETPVGDVEATLHEDHSVSVRNVPAYRYKKQSKLMLKNMGKLLVILHGAVTGSS